MKDGAIYVNTARAGLHDTDALVAALAVRARSAAPASTTSTASTSRPTTRSCAMPNVVLTPHIGGATYDTEANHSKLIADGLAQLLAGGQARQPREPGGARRERPKLHRAGDQGAGAVGRARRCLRTDLVQGTAGNLGARLPDGNVVLTPSSLDYDDDDARRPRRHATSTATCSRASAGPTTEKALHLSALRQHDEIHATMHCHAKFATMFALTRKPIPAVIEEFDVFVGGDVEVADYKTTGTDELADEVAKRVGDRAAVLMANHGLFAVGKDPKDVLHIAAPGRAHRRDRLGCAAARRGRPAPRRGEHHLPGLLPLRTHGEVLSMADAPKSFFLSPDLHGYLVAHAPPIDDVQRDLIEETAELGGISMMQISPEQGAFLTNLTQARRRAVRGRGRDVHRATRRSCIARGLRRRRAHALLRRQRGVDVDRASATGSGPGVDDRIVLQLAPALDTLRALPADEHQIDLAFIDADKPNYPAYYEELLRRGCARTA